MMSEGIPNVWHTDLEQMLMNTWWPCFDPTTTDEQARELAARRLDCEPCEIEIKRTGGCVLCRRKATT
jgi:hypothetical protein